MMPRMVITEYTRKAEKRWGQWTNPSGLQMASVTSSQQMKPPFAHHLQGALSLPERYNHVANQIFHTDWTIWFQKQSFFSTEFVWLLRRWPVVWSPVQTTWWPEWDGLRLLQRDSIWSSLVTLPLWAWAGMWPKSLTNPPLRVELIGTVQRGPGCRLIAESAKSYWKIKLFFWWGASALGR